VHRRSGAVTDQGRCVGTVPGLQRTVRFRSRCAAPGKRSLLPDLIRKITPFRVHLIDELQLPRPAPAFQAALARARFKDRWEFLDANQTHHAVGVRETGCQFLLMLKDASGEIVGDADIENAVTPIGENVDVELLHVRSFAAPEQSYVQGGARTRAMATLRRYGVSRAQRGMK